jgi:hypothetical protein
VDDGKGGTATDTVVITVVDLTPPIINISPGPLTLSADSTCHTLLPALTDAIVATDNCTQATALKIIQTPPAGTPVSTGTVPITIKVEDESGNVAITVVDATVKDTTAPTISGLSANVTQLWPVNHKMVPITLTAVVSDNCTLAETEIVSVTSNEAINGPGDGNTTPDYQITGKLTLNLRAERSGNGNSRIYTIRVQVTDASGNSATGTVNVTVPHDKGK